MKIILESGDASLIFLWLMITYQLLTFYHVLHLFLELTMSAEPPQAEHV